MNDDFDTPEKVKALMLSSRSEGEWNANCRKVKAPDNLYPDWWYSEIILGGIVVEAQLRWRQEV